MRVSPVRLLASVGRALTAVRLAGFALAGLALTIVVGAYSYEVVSRYFFGAPTWWSAQLVSCMLCVMTFAAMPQVTATGGQIAVTFALDTLAIRKRIVVERMLAATGCILCLAITVFAMDETGRQVARNIQLMAIRPIPKWWVSVWLAFGFGLSALEFLRMAIRMPLRDATGADPREATY